MPTYNRLHSKGGLLALSQICYTRHDYSYKHSSLLRYGIDGSHKKVLLRMAKNGQTLGVAMQTFQQRIGCRLEAVAQWIGHSTYICLRKCKKDIRK
jgi:hypothetical protein